MPEQPAAPALTPEQCREHAATLMRLGALNVDDPWIRGHLHNAGITTDYETVQAIRQQMHAATVTVDWPDQPTQQCDDRLAAILRATAEGLHLPAGGDPNAIPAAAAAAYDAAANLRVQLDRINTARQQLAAELAETRDTGYRHFAAYRAANEQHAAEWANLRDLIGKYGDDGQIPVSSLRQALRDGRCGGAAASVPSRRAQEDDSRSAGQQLIDELVAENVALRQRRGQAGEPVDVLPAPKLATGGVVAKPVDLHFGLPVEAGRWPMGTIAKPATPPLAINGCARCGAKPGDPHRRLVDDDDMGTIAKPATQPQPAKRGAFDIAREALLARYGTLDPEQLRILGADSTEIGAARNIAKRLR